MRLDRIINAEKYTGNDAKASHNKCVDGRVTRSGGGSAGDAQKTDDEDERGENDEELRKHRSRPASYFGASGGAAGGVAGVAGADAGALAGVDAGAVAGADDDVGAGVLAGAAGFAGGADPLNTDPGPR